MSAQIIDENDGIQLIQRCLDARSHWLIVGASPLSLELMEGIESRFYDDGSLMLMLVPFNREIIALGLGDKCKMSPAQLAEACHIPVPTFQDILMAPDTPLNVLQWLQKTFKSQSLN